MTQLDQEEVIEEPLNDVTCGAARSWDVDPGMDGCLGPSALLSEPW